MKYQILTSSFALGATFALLGCGDGDECRVVSNDDGSATILCTDGSTTEIPRPASGKPPETCAIVDIGNDRFVRCGDIDYPIGSTSPLCASGYFEGDIFLSADASNGVDEFILSGCKKLRGALLIDGGQPGDDPRGFDSPGTIEIPEALLALEEISGNLSFENFIGGPSQSFANLVMIAPPGSNSEYRGLLSFYNSTMDGALLFPNLASVSTVEFGMMGSTVVELPAVKDGIDAYGSSDEPSDVLILLYNSGVHTLRLPSVERLQVASEGDILREFTVPKLQAGYLAFGITEDAVLNLPPTLREDVYGTIFLFADRNTSAWNAILPNVEFYVRG